MQERIVVVIESSTGEVEDHCYSMLAAGRKLADELDARLDAIVFEGLDVARAQLGLADRILRCCGDSLHEFNPGAWLQALGEQLSEGTARYVLLAQSTIGSDLASAVGAMLGLPVLCSVQAIGAGEAELRYTSLTCGGKLLATGTLPERAVLTVLPGIARAKEGRAEGLPPAEDRVLQSPAPKLPRFVDWIEPDAADVDISKVDVLVSLGRGMSKEEDLESARELAKALGGEVCASRPLVDQGRLEATRLVGKSGKKVGPKLYLALGISGAPEHLEGLSDPELVIAVNTDESAPIFEVADYGAVLDARELLHALTERLAISH